MEALSWDFYKAGSCFLFDFGNSFQQWFADTKQIPITNQSITLRKSRWFNEMLG